MSTGDSMRARQSTSSQPYTLPRFDFEDRPVFGSAPNPQLPSLVEQNENDSFESIQLRRNTEPGQDDRFDNETRANPRRFGFINDPDDGSFMFLVQLTPTTPNRPSFSFVTNRRPSLVSGSELSRSNAVHRASRDLSEEDKERGPPKVQAKKNPDKRARVIRYKEVDGTVMKEQFRPVKIDYEKAALPRTPSVRSRDSEIDRVSPLLPRSGLARDWEESRREPASTTVNFDEIITNRVRCHTWASEVQPGEKVPVSPIKDPSPTSETGRRESRGARRAKKQMEAIQRDRDSDFESMRDAPPTTFAEMNLFDRNRPAFVPKSPPAQMPLSFKDVPFDAARLTRKVFGVHRDSYSQPGSRKATRTTPQTVLKDSTNVASSGGQQMTSGEQMKRDAFGSPASQLRAGRSRTDLLHGLPPLDTNSPSHIPVGASRREQTPNWLAPTGDFTEQLEDQTRQRQPTNASHISFRDAARKATSNIASKFKKRTGGNKRSSNEDGGSTDSQNDRPRQRGKVESDAPGKPNWLKSSLPAGNPSGAFNRVQGNSSAASRDAFGQLVPQYGHAQFPMGGGPDPMDWQATPTVTFPVTPTPTNRRVRNPSTALPTDTPRPGPPTTRLPPNPTYTNTRAPDTPYPRQLNPEAEEFEPTSNRDRASTQPEPHHYISYRPEIGRARGFTLGRDEQGEGAVALQHARTSARTRPEAFRITERGSIAERLEEMVGEEEGSKEIEEGE